MVKVEDKKVIVILNSEAWGFSDMIKFFYFNDWVTPLSNEVFCWLEKWKFFKQK